jgi:hypothetical protein
MLSLFKGIKKYLEIRYNIVRLDITEKTIIVLSILLQVIIIAVLLSVILILLSLFLANFLGIYWDNMGLGLLAAAGMDTLFLLIFIIFRDYFILKPLSKILIRHLGKQLVEEDDEEDDI